MKSIQIYASRIADTIEVFKPRAQKEKLLTLLRSEGLDTGLPILYGYDSVQCVFWFRNDPRGETIDLPLHKVKVWPEGTRPQDI